MKCRILATFLAWKYHGMFCVVYMCIELCMFDLYNQAIYIMIILPETDLRQRWNSPITISITVYC